MPAKYYGKYSGIVRDNVDIEKLGKITVSVPAIFPEQEEMIARPALPYGFFFVPEVGATVWVEFEGGDTTKPLWTGLQYLQGEWAREAASSPPEKRAIQTAKGHLVMFNDRSGEEAIEITHGQLLHTVKLDRDGVSIKDGRGGHELTFDASTITVRHGATGARIEIGFGGITVDAGGGVINLSSLAALPVLRVTDQGIGNLGAPVVMTGPGNPFVKA